jgi:gliding motility-associated-like protein
MKYIKQKLGLLMLVLLTFAINPGRLQAQCLDPYVISASICANSPIQFKTDAIGYSNLVWDFAGTTIPNDPSPIFNFPSPGTYQVTLTYRDAAGNLCTRTISVTVLPSPVIDVTFLTPVEQCYQGNRFTLFDNSKAAAGSSIRRVKYVAAGLQIEEVNPSMPYSFDFSTADPAGGFYTVDIEIEDANGCIVVTSLQDAVEVKPNLGLNFTSTRPRGCDSVRMRITNNSLIPLSQVASFEWDFGDGNKNTTDWGPNIDHWYKTQGPQDGNFQTCLKVTDLNGCTETFCFQASATNLIFDLKIIPDKDSLCFEGNNVVFTLDPGLPPGSVSFLWVFGDPDSGPMNFNNRTPETADHTYTKPGPFMTTYTFVHPICGVRTLDTFIAVLGPSSDIPGPDIPINQRYQCRSIDTVFFPNGSTFFHNDRNFGDDAAGFFDTAAGMWIYEFEGGLPKDEDNYLDFRGKDCSLRVWDFDDDYAPRCTTDSRPGFPQHPRYRNMHMSPDPVTGLFPKNTYDANGNWINCRFSVDSLPKHFYTDWEDIFIDSYYLQGQTFQKTIYVLKGDTVVRNGVMMTDGCFRIVVDTSDFEEFREQFYLQVPRCYSVRLVHQDTCHDFQCESTAITQISIMKPRASGMQRRGRFCFGGPPNYGVTFELEGTRPGCTSSEAYINADTALNPNGWVPFLPGGQTGEYSGPSPIMDYSMSGPYPNELFLAYPNPGSIKDTLRGYAHVGLIIANGTGSNRCEDTAYYPNFIKFPVIDSDVEILLPKEPLAGYTNVWKVCRWDSLVMKVSNVNKTVPFDVDQVSYVFQRIAPADNELRGRYPFYSYVIFENYEWFKPMVDNNGVEYLENSLTKTVARTYGTSTVQLDRQTFVIGKVTKWEAEADVSQIRFILDRAFDALGFIMSELTPKEIADIIQLGCIDTTGLGRFITFYINPLERESYHFRDTTIFALDQFDNDPSDYRNNAYTFIAEENGIFNFNFQIRSRIGGCLTQNGNRVIVGFYNTLDVEDSVICRETDIVGEPYFRYWHIDPDNNNHRPTWEDPTDYWGTRENEAGQPGIEGFTKWDWHSGDDNPGNMQTIFGSDPYGTISYSPIIIGGTGANRIYYLDSGIYRMRVAAMDSLGCEDTIKQNIYVSRLFANFGFRDTLIACVNIVTVFDSTILTDPCPREIGRKCDEIIEWEYTWGDGKRNDFFNRQTYPPLLGFNVGHNYTRPDTFLVKLRVKTLLGCEDSFTRVLIIQGPQPEFITDKLEVCTNEPITFYNKSRRVTPTSSWVWRFGDGSARSFNFANNEDTFTHIYTRPGLYDAYLTMFDSVAGRYCGFTYPDTTGGSQQKYTLTVLPLDSVKITSDRDKICPGEEICFEATADPDYIGFEWNFDADNPNSTAVRFTPENNTCERFMESGVYMIVVRGIPDPNLNMCPTSDTMFIQVDTVKANFEIDSLRKPNFCFENTAVNAAKTRWSFMQSSDIRETGEAFMEELETNDKQVCKNYFDNIGTWWVCQIVENEAGCLDTLCKMVTYLNLMQIPNVFTPAQRGSSSGDGLNDVFNIPIVGQDLYELTIRNRWGDIVFKSDDSEFDWDGTVKNKGVPCPDGTYFYTFRFRFAGNDEIVDINGVVQLIRENP